MADERVAGSHDLGGLRQLGRQIEDQYADGDVARLELTFASWVPQFSRNAVRAAADTGLRITRVDLVEPVRIDGDVLMIRWRKNLGILAGVAIIIGLLALTMFTGWLLYSSDWVVPTALDYFTSLFVEQQRNAALATTGSVSTSAGTITTSLFAFLVWGFFGLLLLWGLAIASRREFWRQLSVKKVLPVLCFIPLLASLSTGFWTLERYYVFAVPFIAWFLTQEWEKRRHLAIVFLIVFFPYAFGLRYYAEALDYPPSSEYIVSRYIMEEIPDDATVVQGVRYGPDFRALANAVEGPDRGDILSVSEAKLRPGRDFRYALFSTWSRDHVIFYLGEEDWNKANIYFHEVPSSIIYSNGDDLIHYYEAD